MTRLLKRLLPEHGLALLVVFLGWGLGFGAFSLNSSEALASRLFRWTVVMIATAGFAVFLPVADQMTFYGRLEGPPSFGLYDVLFSLMGVLASVIGIRHARRQGR